MACFDNIVSLRELCTVPDPQTFYLNQIGLTLTQVEDLMTSDYSSAQNFVDEKSAFAVRLVQSEVHSLMTPTYRANSLLASSRVGYEAAQKLLITQSGMVGVEVKVTNQSSFVDFTISDISLFLDFTGTVNLLVYDLLQGKLLGTLVCTSISGEIVTTYETITVSSARKNLHLWIGYDSDADSIGSYKTVTHTGCSSCSGFTFSNRFIRATGASIETPFTAGQIDSLTHTAGISFNFSVGCNHYDWICIHRAALGLPILYRTGMEIMNHALTAALGQRTVNMTTVSKEQLEETQSFYTAKYNETMRSIMNAMRPPSDTNCFHCSQGIKSVTTLP